MTTHGQKIFRLRGIPEDIGDAKSVRHLVGSTLGLPDVAGVKIRSVARSPYDNRKRIATLDFVELPPALSDECRSEWEFELIKETSEDDDEDLSPDTLTCVALSGLNGHAFGSFKRKGGLFMWLRDGLSVDVPAARILVYGYDTKLVNSTSFQTLQDWGRSLFMGIQDVRTDAADSEPT
ncbi:hypothetical protein SLS58_006934 [Diplodia intermedia]|uniref:Uncharacterized protein n=1 Tax=Diplodia intermedia TaxID=856260 RepID=A0ABR3TLS9_9PEZI